MTIHCIKRFNGIYRFFFAPFLEAEDFKTFFSLISAYSLKFRNQKIEDEYVQNQKEKLTGIFRIATSINIIIQIIFFFNNKVVLNGGIISWLRFGFIFWFLFHLLIHTRMIKFSQYYVDVTQYINSVFHVYLTIVYIDTIFIPNLKNHNQEFDIYRMLNAGSSTALLTICQILVCFNWLTQSSITITTTLMVLIKYKLTTNYGIWVIYPILFLISLLFRFKEYLRRLDFYRIYQQTQNLQACISIFDKTIKSSIVIISSNTTNNIQPDNIIPQDDLQSPKNYRILYNNQYLSNHIQNKNVSEGFSQFTKSLTLYQEKDDQSKNFNSWEQPSEAYSLYDMILSYVNKQNAKKSIFDQLNFRLKRDYQEDYQLDNKLVDYIFFREREQPLGNIEDNVELAKKDFFDVKISDCVWEGKNAVMIHILDISEKFQIQNLRQLDFYKNNLLTSVSHDLKNPLNQMHTMVEMIQQLLKEKTFLSKYEIQKINQFFKEFMRNHTFLLNMINDLLDYQQIIQGSIKFEIQKFDIRQTLSQIIQLFKDKVEEKGIRIYVNNYIQIIEQNIVFNDETRLKQVLINLVENAVKFTKHGQIVINLFYFMERNHDYIKVEVIDSGIGIPTHILSHLFKLYTTYNPQNLNPRGIGLGLAISRKLVGFLGPENRIQLESELECGSKFSFKIFVDSPLKSDASLKINSPLAHENIKIQEKKIKMSTKPDSNSHQYKTYDQPDGNQATPLIQILR